MVVPEALRVLRLKPGRKYCTVKVRQLFATVHLMINLTVFQRLSHEVGWGYKDVVDRLEVKRKLKAQAYFERKVSFSHWTQSTLELMTTASECRSQASPEGDR